MIILTAVAIAEARMGKPGEKYYSGRSRAIMERAYITFKSSTWLIVISGFVEPVLFLLSFGYGLKDLVGDMTVAGQPVGYVAFIAPALHRKEKRTSVLFVASATPFFAMGATLGYLILPVAIKALFGFTPSSISNLVRFDDYLDFVLRVILFVGLAFELPIFLLTFNLIGFLRGKTILKPWRIWIFTIFFFVAALSPTADPLSMVLLSGPLILFYFMAGLIAVVVDRRRDKKAISVETGSAGIEAPTSIKE